MIDINADFWMLAKKCRMYGYQEKLMKEDADRIIINKSRQIGISSFYAFKSLIGAMNGKKIIIVSPSEKQSNNFLNYAKECYVNIVNRLKDRISFVGDGLVRFTHEDMWFEGGGRMLSLPNSSKTIRGFTGDEVIMDEVAHIDNANELYEAVAPMIIRGGKITLISTPLGENGLFAEYWRGAEAKGFKKVLINYRECPDFTEDKMAVARKSMDELSWRQEYENEFLGTVDAYFPMDLIGRCVDPELTLWEYPEQIEGKLMFGADIGRVSDKTSIIGIDQEGRVKYRKSMENKSFAEQREFMEGLLPKASVMRIDSNGIGMQLAEELQNRGGGVVVKATITNELKLNGFINLRRKMEQGELKMPDDMGLKRSLNLIVRRQTGTTITFDAPRTDETGHSDEAMALMLAAYDDGGGIYVPDVGF